MSDIEDSNYKQESKKKQTQKDSHVVNITNDRSATKIEEDETDGNEKKKKIIKYSVIGGGILIAIVLIVTLSVTLTSKDEGG